MKFLYNLGIKAYGMAARVAAMRGGKARLFVDGRKDALAALAAVTASRAPQGYDLWVHAASLGEFEQARPIIEAVKSARPDTKILLTFFSPSGYTVRKDYPLATAVVYLPEDTAANAAEFLDIARPRKAVFVKYEFWINFLTALSARHIPVYLVSAIFRPGQIFFKPWGRIFRKALHCYSHIFVQTPESARLLQGIGVTGVTVAGDTRIDRVYDIMQGGKRFEGVEKWLEATPFTVVAGSSWPADEDVYLPWLNAHPEVKAIIAPHEFDARRLEALQQKIKAPSVLWSRCNDGTDIPADAQVLVVDTFGKLSSIYRYASVAIVGGGLGAGIHNINEAAVYGIPVIFGPNNRKFREARDLKTLGGGSEYTSAASAAQLLENFRTDSAARERAGACSAQYIADNRGATALILKELLS